MFKTFFEFLNEEMRVPNIHKSLGRLRHGMPQLGKFDDFMADLKKNKVKSTLETIEPKKLIPTQKNFNQEKVDKMIADGGWDKKPIISSKDNYVVDGHHRWLAAHQSKKKVQSRVIDMNAEDLLDFLDGKEYVEKKKINEELV